MEKYLAQIELGPDGGFKLPGALGQENYNIANTASRLTQVISTVIGVMTVVGFIWFTFLLFTGAIQYIFSGGDKSAVEGAMAKIRTALIGLVVLISAIFFIQLIGRILGIPDVLNIGNLFTNLVTRTVDPSVTRN